MFSWFKKKGENELENILSGFHSVISSLEDFIYRVEQKAYAKMDKASMLQKEASTHLDDSAKAKAVSANIKSLLGS